MPCVPVGSKPVRAFRRWSARRLLRILFTVLIGSFLMLSACTSGYCRRSHRDAKGQLIPHHKNRGQAEGRPTAFVYKYDGSLQCDMGQAVAVDKMAVELKSIRILSQEKKHDGLMHIQVCGAQTGNANVYEIDLEDLKEAQEKGFKEWDF